MAFDNNPYKYLSKCAVFVLSSNSEGFPNVVVEAMVCGCCVISTDCLSGPREILAPNSDFSFRLEDDLELAQYGVLVPIQNKELLAKAMGLILDDKELRNGYKQKAFQRAKDFAVEKILKQYEEVICAE